jgi:hypothetical protein
MQKMTHFEMYGKLVDLRKMYDAYYEKEYEYVDSVWELTYCVIQHCYTTCNYAIDKFRGSEMLCLSCLYRNFNMGRKTLHRYFIIETELHEDVKAFLQKSQDLFQEICMNIKHNNKINEEEETCTMQIKNTAFSILNRLN